MNFKELKNQASNHPFQYFKGIVWCIHNAKVGHWKKWWKLRVYYQVCGDCGKTLWRTIKFKK